MRSVVIAFQAGDSASAFTRTLPRANVNSSGRTAARIAIGSCGLLGLPSHFRNWRISAAKEGP